jgi:4-amino-4-deoxy-L-arabinose transferase-like glycosyltransferase
MAARRKSRSDPETISPPVPIGAAQQLLLFALFFAGLMLLHAPLLRLPYFWDEAGYYVPAARDLFLTGSLVPHTTVSNAHPPLVMAWLALSWHVFGFSALVTRTAMLAFSAFALLGLFNLAKVAASLPIAWATVALVSVYPPYFTQSSMAQLDLPVAGLTFWALAAYIGGYDEANRNQPPWKPALWFSLAALTKETAILAPLALFCWEGLAYFGRQHAREKWKKFLPPQSSASRALYLLLPIVPLSCWYAYHYAKTGFLLGNPEFFRYNVAATVNPLRMVLALGLRLWQLLGYFSLYLVTLAGLLAMFRSPQKGTAAPRPRIPFWMQTAFLAVVLAYLVFMSVVGGAVLARYILPVVPLVILLWVATLWRRVLYWKIIVAAIAVAFAAGLFSNPPYGFSMEDNLAYRDYVMLHADACRFLALRYPGARVLTAWPASDELSRPWLGYVNRPFPVVRIEDFSTPQVDLALSVRNRYDVVLVFSTKYQPPHPYFENWQAWRQIKEKFFGYHIDQTPEQLAKSLGGLIDYSTERNGQWIAVVVLEKK